MARQQLALLPLLSLLLLTPCASSASQLVSTSGASNTNANAAARTARREMRPCQVLRKNKVVDVGGFLGWSLGMYGVWKQPKVYVGDRLRFTWPAAPGEGDRDLMSMIFGAGGRAWIRGKGRGRGGRRGRDLAVRKAGKILEHNVYVMTASEFRTCSFRSSSMLAEANYTTPKFTKAGTYYYGCEEDKHCAAGQKVAIVVQPAVKYVPCPPKPPPSQKGLIYVGKAPAYWTLDVIFWKQPTVRTGDTLVFRWDKNTAAPPHDVWLASSKASYDACSTAGGTKLSEVTNTGQVKYKVKAAAGKKLYFICSYTFHCLVGMKTAIKIS